MAKFVRLLLTVLLTPFLICCLIVATMSSSIATELVALDGVWWTALTDSEQIVAVQALLGAYEQGYSNGYIHAVSKDKSLYHSTRSIAQYTNDPESHTYFGKTFGTYQRSIVDFYSQYPKSTDVLVGDVIACLSDKPQFTCKYVASFTLSK